MESVNLISGIEYSEIHASLEQGGKGEFGCEVCDKQFYIRSEYEKHLRTHTGEKPYTLPCIEHDRLPFSDILGAPTVLSAPQLMFYLLPLAPRILKSGETYL